MSFKYRTSIFFKRHGTKLTMALVIIIMFFYVILPLYELIVTSFKYDVDYLAIPKIFIPTRYTMDNYIHVFGMDNIGRYFSNSLIAASCASVICLIVGVPAAYILVRARFPYRLNYFITFWILFTRMVPPVATMIPYYLIMRKMGILDTRLALIISDTCFNLPFVTWLLMGLIRELPKELEEAARIDGSNNFGVLTRIVTPLLVPGMVSAGTLVFIFAWNDFIYPLFLSSYKAKTLSVVIPGFINDFGVLWGPMSALSLIMVVPVVVVALTFQRYLVRGLTLGSIK
ncbi:MAG: carbohydrate ABC transporter permease [Actinobacteria bacterium]|nr:carbohydrate ABC transporter permease [Actinomycetota bacterium]